MKADLENLLEVTEMKMARWMCGVSLREQKTSKEIRDRLGIEQIGEVLRKSRLRWYGHVMRKNDNDGVKQCTLLEVQGKGPRGGTWKTWDKTVREDMKRKGLKEEDAVDRKRWRKGIDCEG